MSSETGYEEILFWGKIQGLNKDYYILIGINYSNHYEFPEKGFFWASSSDFSFQPFPEMNSQHSAEKYNSIKSLFTGDPKLIHLKVEADREGGEEAKEEQKE